MRKTEVYQCRVCGGRLQVLRRGGGLSCCGEPLKFPAGGGEESSPPLDLFEVRVGGKSYWRFPGLEVGAGDLEARPTYL